ncbi:MAG: M23 family metallopeptidase [Roseiarcus sp.]|jgi:murein DD-endopeptidase MepM/ murein hydrolase activator NlpD|uniref:M23 family metallopeptidase n=1 Tax=Roseiarcus sp. TaxID=1969460 RepID=UPI003C14A306
MSLRDQRSRPAKVRTQFYFSHARGDAIRTVAVRPLVLWPLAAFAVLTLVWASLTTVYLVFHDDMLAALATREAEQQYAYEDRIAEARAELDRVAGRQLLDQSSFEGKLHELLSRQARLEQRGAIVAALADQTTRSLAAAEPPAHASAVAAAKPARSALSAIGAASPLAPADSVIGPAASAFAPVAPIAAAGPQKPRPIDEARPQPIPGPQAAAERAVGADLLAAADNSDLGAAARLSLISVSLDRMERRQATALGEIAADARAGAARLSAVVTRAGLAADTLVAPAAKGGVGGPFIPLTVDPAAPAFDKALAGAARDVAEADRLTRLLPILPVRAPLIGEAFVSSPFGYRTDPFLGRPELHPGVDLVQDYGSEIHATAGGRVTHAGPMGGYGDMVEIDHGNGLVTRYGHLSEILVAEAQEVPAGALLGRLGSTGRSTGPHLHYEVRVDGEPVDPERFLAAGAPLFGTPL